MPDLCARCEAVLPEVGGEAAAYCVQCGLPQLRVSEQVLEAAEARVAAASVAGSSGEMGTAAGAAAGVGPGELDWRRMLPVVAVAAVVGLVPALLMRQALDTGTGAVPALFLMPLLCLGCGLAYQRRRPLEPMSAGKGAQMGLALGVLLALLVVTATGVASFALRYGQHNHTLQQGFDGIMVQTEARVRATQPNAPENFLRMMQSPEWHAGFFLVMEGSLMVLLVLTGGVAGTVAGALLGARQRGVRPQV